MHLCRNYAGGAGRFTKRLGRIQGVSTGRQGSYEIKRAGKVAEKREGGLPAWPFEFMERFAACR